MSPNRCSTQRMSRIISPEMPAVVAPQPITSRSWQSRAKATRTTSPFQQVNSSASEHQRTLERIVATWPSCSCGRLSWHDLTQPRCRPLSPTSGGILGFEVRPSNKTAVVFEQGAVFLVK
jgi:hypothetical protein